MMTHSQTQPQPQTTFKLDLCSVAKLRGIDRDAKKGEGASWQSKSRANSQVEINY
jgi:hypothetical protein